MAEFCLPTDIDEIVDRIRPHASKFAGKTVLITGARGFLGRYFIDIFVALNKSVLDKPVKVIALDNLITAGAQGAAIPEYENIRFIKHDVIEPFEIDEPVDFVIHAAGIASPYYYRAFPLETLEVAITGTKRMRPLCVLFLVRDLWRSRQQARADGGKLSWQRLVSGTPCVL
jgi:UDP-glucuronate decarboxylase